MIHHTNIRCDDCGQRHTQGNPTECIEVLKEQIATLTEELTNEKGRANYNYENYCKEVQLTETLTEERDGYRNGQHQLQDICHSLQDSISKYATERKRLREALERIYQSRATHCQGCKEHGQIAQQALRGGEGGEK